MNIIGIDDEAEPAIGAEFCHAVKVDEEGEEDLVCGGAVLEDAKEICFEGYGGYVAGVEGEGGGGGGECCA